MTEEGLAREITAAWESRDDPAGAPPELGKLVAEGLQAAHGENILHRDVKPANILVRREEAGWKVKIIDFGLAMTQKVTKATCFRWVYDGSSTTAAVTSARDCVKIKK